MWLLCCIYISPATSTLQVLLPHIVVILQHVSVTVVTVMPHVRSKPMYTAARKAILHGFSNKKQKIAERERERSGEGRQHAAHRRECGKKQEDKNKSNSSNTVGKTLFFSLSHLM